MSSEIFLNDICAQTETLAGLCHEYTRRELRESLRRAASVIRAANKPIYLTGMGASFFALLAAKAWLDNRGVELRLEDTAYLIEYGSRTIRPGQPIVLVSQSGRTAEAVALQSILPKHNPLIVITNDQNTDLAKKADFLFPLFAKPDAGVALKTYTASLVLLLMLAAEICEESSADVANTVESGDLIAKAIACSEQKLDSMLQFSGGADYITLLGRGPSIASVLGGALLLKETAKIPAEGANAGQFRHGAIEVISEGSFVVMFAPLGTSSRLNLQLSKQLEKSGAHILFIGPAGNDQSSMRLIVEIDAPNEYLAPVFEIVPLQLLSYAIALRGGVQPGTFNNTTPIVLTR